MTYEELIAQLEAAKVPAAGIRAALKANGASEEEIAELVPKAVKRGFAAEFYDWLAESERTQEEAKQFILDPANSKNVHNHLSHYLNIAKLAERIWNA